MLLSYIQTVVSTTFLFFIVICGYIHNISQKLYDMWEVIEILMPDQKYKGKGPSANQVVEWYSQRYGFTVEKYNVATEDGFILHLERIKKKSSVVALNINTKGTTGATVNTTSTNDEDGTGNGSTSATANTTSNDGTGNVSSTGCGIGRGRPILLQHGLFQSSGVFVVANKKKSLAYYLADLGFDVWLGNNRAVLHKHSKLTPNDEAYWDWTIHELGRYDFPALVKFIVQQTKQKVIYVGHSQGNAQAFVGLSINPAIAEHLDLFVAMAPAYYVNEFKHWSLKLIQKLPDRAFWLLFGRKSFINIMHPCQMYFPHRLFSSFAYTMFAYLFGWTSDRWNRGLKPTLFQTTPRPISTKLIKHWLTVSKTGKLTHHDPASPEHSDYPLSAIRCPVAVCWGKGDSLVDGERLLKAMKRDGVPVVFELGVDNYEHMDLVWAEDAVQKVFQPLVGLLQKISGDDLPDTSN